MLAYALTIFTGAFLLFQVQPLIGKFILPWFGGMPAVWTTCLLFFQVLLLGGYAYAHWLTRWLKPRSQAFVHGVLLLSALAALPIIPAAHWKPPPGIDPTWRILALLAATIGLPYFVLSSTGPLMQVWLGRTHPHRSPYRLYALSNMASMLALATYPFWVEPNLSRKVQAGVWSVGLAFFVLVCGYCAWRLSKVPNESVCDDPVEPEAAPPTFGQMILWVGLPACATVLLLATTNKLCQDVAVIPFLWVLPLTLYLLSFVLCFDHPRWYVRPLFSVLLPCVLAAMCWALFCGVYLALPNQICIYSAGLFVGCMICHGELSRLKPHPRYLTTFYLMLATGGALGGVFVALVAPLVFNSYLEFHIGLWACVAFVLWICLREKSFAIAAGIGAGGLCVTVSSAFVYKSVFREQWWWWGGAGVLLIAAFIPRTARGIRHWTWRAWGYSFVALLGLGWVLLLQVRSAREEAVLLTRNFYGALAVLDLHADTPEKHHFVLQHGRITHGLQATDPTLSFTPTSYYVESSGIGLALRHFPRQSARRIGVVGLGTGTLAAYGRKGDVIRIYEINPQIRRLAENWFTYLKQCPAKVEIVMGDARLSMEAESPQQYDVLALDAFSSDAIPVHLLTREAVEIYLRHLKSDGILAVHVSNRYLNLRPVVANLAKHFKLGSAVISDNSKTEWWSYSSTWVLLTHNSEFLAMEPIRDAVKAEGDSTNSTEQVALWTDDHASLLEILK
jgi:hypothetical protein